MGGVDDFFGNFFGRFGGDPIQKRKKFETELFKDGVFVLDEHNVPPDARRFLAAQKEWYSADHGSGMESSLLFQERNKGGHELLWKRRFSGRIPLLWDDWENIVSALQVAQKKGITLNRELIDAAATHPDGRVVQAVGTTQRLNTQQLAWVFTEPSHIDEWGNADGQLFHFNKIIQAQKKLGTPASVLMHAQEIAKAIYDTYYGGQGEKGDQAKLELSGIQVGYKDDLKKETTVRGVLFIQGDSLLKEQSILWFLRKFKGPGKKTEISLHVTNKTRERENFIKKNEREIKSLLIAKLIEDKVIEKD